MACHLAIKTLSRRIILFVILFAFKAHSQYQNLKFENLDTSEGLSSSTCLEILQDSEGFMWFGTIDGLNRYDGYNFEIYRPVLNDSTSISNNRINSMVEDTKGNLWIGTSNGLNVFDKKLERFYRIPLHNQSSKYVDQGEIINDVFFDAKTSLIWIATKNGIVKFNIENAKVPYTGFSLIHYYNKPDNDKTIDNNDVSSIVKDDKGVIWAVTEGNYLNAYNSETDTFNRTIIDIPNNYELNHLPKRVLVDKEGDFWIGNNLSMLVIWNRKQNSFNQISPVNVNTPIFDIYQDKMGMICVATDGDGIFLLDKNKGLLQHIEHNSSTPFSLPNNQISKILVDKDGIFWVGTYNKGISKLVLSKSDFGHYFFESNKANWLSAKIAQSVLQDNKNNIWIGTDGGGLNLFNEKKNTFSHFKADVNNNKTLSSNKIVYLANSFDGTIWVCTWDGGLNRFNPATEITEQFKYNSNNPYSIGENTVWCAVEDSKKRLWIGTQSQGLNLFDNNTKKFYKYKSNDSKNSLVSNLVFSIYIDSKNRLLLGTSLGLSIVYLNKLDDYIPNTIEFKELEEKAIQGIRVNNITEDNKGNIWLGTDVAMHQLDSNLKLVKSYSTQNGLPNNLIVGIKQDNNKDFWVTTKGGLSKLDISQNKFYNFTVEDGVQGLEFQSKSIEKLKDGRILAGGINGFNLFDPNKIIEKPVLLKPIFTKFKLFNEIIKPEEKVNDKVVISQSISQTDVIELKYNEGFLAFEFVAFHYENQKRVRYVYRMNGLHEDFINAGANREANYSSIPPGEYVFEVKAFLNNDWEQAQSSRIHIKVLPPPWKTWWAYLLYVLVFAGTLWIAIYYYTKRLREEKEHELDQMKLKFFINVSHELRTPLTLILNPIDKILSSISNPEIVESSATAVQRSARRLLYLVNQLLDFRKMDLGKSPLKLTESDYVKFCKGIFELFKNLAKTKQIRFKFRASEETIPAYFDFDKIEKIISNLLSNAIKYTNEKGSVKLSLSTIKVSEHSKYSKIHKQYGTVNCVQIEIKDTGIGFKSDQLKNVFGRFVNTENSKIGMGIGLNITKGLVLLHGGDIFVKSKYKEGSTFTVILPLVEKISQNQVILSKEENEQEYDLNIIRSAEYEMAILSEDDNEGNAVTENSVDKKELILIVEDNNELRKHLKGELQSNYKIKEAINGVDGFEKIKKYYPDLVISDIMMPEMDGFELCRKVKTDIDVCHIPLVLLTARSLNEDRIEGYQTGADEYIPKPYNIHVLKARVKNLLEAKKRLRNKFATLGGIVPSSEVTSNSLDEAFLDKTTKIILDNVSDIDFKLEDLLSEVGVGRSQFFRKISSLTNQNPSTFIRTVRLKYAADLLNKKQYSIKEIAYMAGFNSTAYFSKTFRELFDVTPTEYLDKNG